MRSSLVRRYGSGGRHAFVLLGCPAAILTPTIFSRASCVRIAVLRSSSSSGLAYSSRASRLASRSAGVEYTVTSLSRCWLMIASYFTCRRRGDSGRRRSACSLTAGTFPSAPIDSGTTLEVCLLSLWPIPIGYWATWISGKAPPSPKSFCDRGIQPYHNAALGTHAKLHSHQTNASSTCRFPYGGAMLRGSTSTVDCDVSIGSSSSSVGMRCLGAGSTLPKQRPKRHDARQSTKVTRTSGAAILSLNAAIREKRVAAQLGIRIGGAQSSIPKQGHPERS